VTVLASALAIMAAILAYSPEAFAQG
jgi:hypothetical protein